MVTRIYAVDGMTCGHCVKSITTEVGKVDGVLDVSLDLDARTVAVTADAVDDGAVRAAMSEAGYTVAG